MHGSLNSGRDLAPFLGRQTWTADQLEYSYRSSILKRHPGQAVVLAARMQLTTSTNSEVQAAMDTFTERRRATQPPGASLGSMFKNPEGDFAGRLIEAAGLKGARIGGVEVSTLHANFFINNEQASARDIYQLIRQVQKRSLTNLARAWSWKSNYWVSSKTRTKCPALRAVLAKGTGSSHREKFSGREKNTTRSIVWRSFRRA